MVARVIRIGTHVDVVVLWGIQPGQKRRFLCNTNGPRSQSFHLVRVVGIFHAQKGGKRFRRYLSENAHKKGAGIDVVKQAMLEVPHS